MEIRKVQITGGSTFMVTLPKQWAERTGLSRGSPLWMVPREEALILVPEQRKRSSTVVLNLEDQSGEALVREIISLYIGGFDVIEVRGERISPERRRVIREISRALIGPEIVEESAGSVIIHNLLDLGEVSSERTFERIFLITKSMFTDAIQAMLDRDKELANDVVGRDSEVDRLFLMLSRQLRIVLQDILAEEQVGMGQVGLFDYYIAAKQLERIADHGVKIAQAATSLEQSISQQLREVVGRAGERVAELLSEVADALRQLDWKRANLVVDRTREAEELLVEMREVLQQTPRSAQVLLLVADSISRVTDYTANIAEVALNAATPLLSHGQGP